VADDRADPGRAAPARRRRDGAREIIENAMRGRLVVFAAVTMVAFAAGCSDRGTGQVTDGKAIFMVHCGGCHTLADAGSTGVVGPNLDQAKPPRSLVVKQVTNGGVAMPSFSDNLSAGHSLTDAEIQAVADYVSSATGR
jgi:mono/diheme cytochrome c family protein